MKEEICNNCGAEHVVPMQACRISDLIKKSNKELLEEVLKRVQEDINFGAENQQIVSIKAQSYIMFLLSSLG